MLQVRVIPCLLLRGRGLVKTVRFRQPVYVGDPINAVRIFNEKEVDELLLLDIYATRERRGPPLNLLEEISSECFMPLAYGGGIRSLADIKALFALGVEKVAINAQAVENPRLIREAADAFGSQSVMASIDAKRSWLGACRVVTHGGINSTLHRPADFAREMERYGAGEILLNSVDRDGTMQGYDLELIRDVSRSVGVPLIACGGAGKLADFAAAVTQGGASAVAAGSMFVFHGKHRAVLINYPSRRELEAAFNEITTRSDTGV